MVEISIRQLSMLFLSAGMITVGVLGLSRRIEPTPAMGAVLLLVAIVLLINLGRLSRSLK